jgi:hypothetical protein
MRVALEVNVMRLRFDPVMNRPTLFVCLTLIWWTFWFQWWDTERCRDKRILWRSWDRLMCATGGVHVHRSSV